MAYGDAFAAAVGVPDDSFTEAERDQLYGGLYWLKSTPFRAFASDDIERDVPVAGMTLTLNRCNAKRRKHGAPMEFLVDSVQQFRESRTTVLVRGTLRPL